MNERDYMDRPRPGKLEVAEPVRRQHALAPDDVKEKDYEYKHHEERNRYVI